jgi:probable HAF family extracellular repeat protein
VPKPRVSVLLLGCSLALVLSLCPVSAHSQTYTFTTIDVPNAQETVCMDINDGGNVVGYYIEDGVYHGFLLKNGTFTTLTFPAAVSTLAYGINDFDQIVGSYGEGGLFGFEISGGQYISGWIDDPNSDGFNYVWGITNTGEIVGSYNDTSGALHGFTDIGGTFTTINVPNAETTEIFGINRLGQLVGIAEDHARNEYGFRYTNGRFLVFSFPGAGWTSANRINDQGEIVGSYSTSASGPFSGFTQMGSVFTTVTFPGATDTQVLGLNNSGTVVGQYTDTSGVIHGFIATPQ